MTRPPDGARPRKPPTMADVAQVAGVSHQTVSRVLSKHPHVRDATREEVLRAIDQLGYRRNSSARALVTHRTLTLGVVVACNPTLFGPASTLFGLEEAARDEGYLMSAVTLRQPTARALTDAIDHLSEWGVEGTVVIVPQREAVAALAALKTPFPLVTVEGGHDLQIPGVCVDQELGARMVTSHLLAAGHRTVWHVAGPQDWLEAAARAKAWRATLEEAGAEVPPVLRGDWTPLSGYRAGQELAGRVAAGSARQGVPEVTAVFVANDQMALGVLRAFREAGLSVPGQVAIAGFDDIPEAEFFTPPLTTVRQDFAAVGEASIKLLVSRIASGARTGLTAGSGPNGRVGPPDGDGDDDAVHVVDDERVVIEPHLIIRSSSTR